MLTKPIILIYLIVMGLFLYSCDPSGGYKYTITIPWEGSSYYYYTNELKIDSLTKCVTFVEQTSSIQTGKQLHTLCGTYQITQNK